ncbi:MAG TPA: thiamine pyrophosphate-dependent enzyme, partial [Chloroflexota bacterium]
KAALAHQGVAHITIPKDIQGWTQDDDKKSTANIAHHSSDVYQNDYPAPAQASLQKAADLINAGKKVVILAGRGALSARDELIQLAEKVGGPIVKPLLGKATVPDDSPYTTGGIGLLGTSASENAMQAADTIIIVGSSFPYQEFLPRPDKARGVQIDIKPTKLGLRFPVELGLVGDAKKVLLALLPLIERKADRSFLEEAQKNMRAWRTLMETRGTRQDMPMKPQVPAHQINKFLASDALIVSDTGTVTTWAARHIMIKDRMQFSASGMLASMGNGLPYAVGAAIGNPGRQVVALVGDGGFTMLMGELATIVKYKLPVKILLFRNNVLGEIKWEQLVMSANPQFGVELEPIDFAAYARACGAGGFTLERPQDCESILQQAFAHPGPALIDAIIDPNEPPMPGKIKTEMAIHFAEALAGGEKERGAIVKTVVEDFLKEHVREVV